MQRQVETAQGCKEPRGCESQLGVGLGWLRWRGALSSWWAHPLRGGFWNVGVGQSGWKSKVETSHLTNWCLLTLLLVTCIMHCVWFSSLAAWDLPLRPVSAVVPSFLLASASTTHIHLMDFTNGLCHGQVLASCPWLLCSYVEGNPLGTLIRVTHKGRVY